MCWASASLRKPTYRADRDSHKLDLALDNDYVIELFSFPNAPARPSYPEATGLRHLAFEVKNVRHTVEELAAKGVVAEPVRMDEE